MDKRKSNRFTVTSEDIKGALLFTDNVKILNISLSGIALHADKGFKIGKEYTIRMQVKDKVVPIKGIVVWCRLSQSRNAVNGDVIPIYSMGFQFSDAPTGDVEEIIDFVKTIQNQTLDATDDPYNNPFIPDTKAEDDEVLYAFNEALKEQDRAISPEG